MCMYAICAWIVAAPSSPGLCYLVSYADKTNVPYDSHELSPWLLHERQKGLFTVKTLNRSMEIAPKRRYFMK